MIAYEYDHDRDYEEMKRIVSSHAFMYGVKIDAARFVARLDRSTKDSMTISIFRDGKLFGCAKQNFWSNLPIWSVGSMFFDDNRNSPSVFEGGRALFEFMSARAEADDRYDYYYVVRDTGTLRKDMTSKIDTAFATRYDVIDVEVVPPHTLPKCKAFEWMLDALSGHNTKTLVIRHGYLRPEFRKDVWAKV